MIKRFDLKLGLFPLICDLILTDVALCLARQLRLTLDLGADLGPGAQWFRFDPALYIVVCVIWAVTFILMSVYDKQRTRRVVGELQTVALATVLAAFVLFGVTTLFFKHTSRLLLVYFVILDLLILSVWRVPLRLASRTLDGGWPREIQRLLVEGTGKIGRKVRGEFVALGLLIVIVSVVNIAWIIQDTRPQPGVDPNVYLKKTLDFVDRLRVQSEDQLPELVAGLSMAGRPPLYQLFSVPFIVLFGRSIDAALLVNIFFEAILILSTYGIGRLVGNGKAGLVAALLVAAYPPIVNLARIYRPDFALPACVALSLWLLLLLLKTRSIKIAWLFGASLGYGMWIRHFFAFLLPVPTVLFGFYMALFQTDPRRPLNLKETPPWLLSKLRDPFVLYGLLPAALIATGLTASWYLTDAAAPLFALQQKIQAGDLGTVTRGFHDVASYSFWWYALTAPGAMSYVFTALFVIGLALGIARRRSSTFVLIVTFLAAYIALGLQKGLGWKRFAAVLPVVAVLTSAWIVDIRHKLLSTTLTLICVAVAVLNFSVVTWGVSPWSQPIAAALGAPLNSDTCAVQMTVAFCPWPARDEDWHANDILRVILDDPECREHECCLMLLREQGGINHHIFQYYLAQDFPDVRLMIRGVNLGYITQASRLKTLLKSEYFLYTSGSKSPESDDYPGLLRRFVQSPPPIFADAHHEVASFNLPDGSTVRLLRRIRALTIEETDAAIEALNIPEENVGIIQQGLKTQKQQRTREIEKFLDGGAIEDAFDLTMQTLDSDMLTGEEKATLAANVGNRLISAGEITRTIELLNQVPPDVKDARAWFILGRAYRREQRLDEAIVAFEQALILDPQHYWANSFLAGIYAEREEWEAVVWLEQVALEVAPNDERRAASGMRLARAYGNLGDRENACAVLEQIQQWAEQDDARIENLRERFECQK